MRIAIVGCGIGGMAAAIALSRDGHDVSLFERFAQPHPVGAGLLLQPTGLGALQTLGLREEVEARGARVSHLRGRTPRGRTALALSYADWAPGAHGVGVHRAALFDTLFRALQASSAKLIADTHIVRIEERARPRLIDERGTAHGPFDLAIVADGAASSLRAQITPHARAPLYPWGAIWTIRPDPDDRWANVLDQVYASAKVMIGVLPIGAGIEGAEKQVAFFWSLREDDYAAWRAGGIDAWRARVASYWPEAARLLEGDLDFKTLNFARYRDVQAWPWGDGNVVLIGDCAHATSPQLGQGANLALVDAVTLAATLKQTQSVEDALRAYRRARAGKVAWVQFMSAALTPLYQSRSALMGWVRDWLMPPLAKIWPLNRIMLATLTGAGVFPFAMLLSRVAKFLLWGRPRG
jgi:2-polyprenyl-6-methoxyphenol hydroxylase-like FAD-dependent oxidoreductase